MGVITSYPCQFRIYSVRCGNSSNNYCNVVFEVKSDNFSLPLYISFSFTSFDAMNLHLKNLARNYNSYSVDLLFSSYFPANIFLEENFNSPTVFRKLSFRSNLGWPARDSFGMILLE